MNLSNCCFPRTLLLFKDAHHVVYFVMVTLFLLFLTPDYELMTGKGISSLVEPTMLRLVNCTYNELNESVIFVFYVKKTLLKTF